MREIKFRAWNGNQMLQEFGFYFNKMGMPYQVNEGFAHLESLPKESLNFPFKVMQFTGLKDKNGVEIYEGDIVKAFISKTAEVKFGDYMVEGSDYYSNYSTAGFYIDYGNSDDSTSKIISEEVEVIGNIYQNPELLK